jgi:hypothetical protein
MTRTPEGPSQVLSQLSAITSPVLYKLSPCWKKTVDDLAVRVSLGESCSSPTLSRHALPDLYQNNTPGESHNIPDMPLNMFC